MAMEVADPIQVLAMRYRAHEADAQGQRIDDGFEQFASRVYAMLGFAAHQALKLRVGSGKHAGRRYLTGCYGDFGQFNLTCDDYGVMQVYMTESSFRAGRGVPFTSGEELGNIIWTMFAEEA